MTAAQIGVALGGAINIAVKPMVIIACGRIMGWW